MTRSMILLTAMLTLFSGCSGEPQGSPHFVPSTAASPADGEAPVKPLHDVPPPTKIQMH